MPVRRSEIINYLPERRLVLPSNESTVHYWGLHIYQAILNLTQAANAPIARRVEDLPSITAVPIA